MVNFFEDTAAAFREEALELLGELESGLLELEKTPDEKEVVSAVFRALHTIKGSGAMFGFDEIAAFTHEVETVFDLVRSGQLAVSREMIDFTLAAGDHIRVMIEGQAPAQEAARIIDGLRACVSCLEEGQEPPGEASAPPPRANGDLETLDPQTFRVLVRARGDLDSQGVDMEELIEELKGLGECYVIDACEPVDADQTRRWDIILTTQRGENAVRDVFVFVEGFCEVRLDLLDGGAALEGEEIHKRLGQILVERGDIQPQDLEAALSSQRRLGDILAARALVSPAQVESALAEQNVVRQIREKRRGAEKAATVRVPADRLDKLVNLVGELVTVQARLSQTAGQREDMDLTNMAEEVERLTSELRDNTMSIRMLPIGTVTGKFERLVRDLSLELGKKVVFVAEGVETELDKTVIEKLNDPMVHIIRNSLDHGVETPEQRLAAGKPAEGTIRFSAFHSGASVVIEINDDGAGVDLERIRLKAVEKGLVSPEAQLAEAEIMELLFAPGFSTSASVTNVSGRGVGMDVVKKGIESLGGTINISSQPGRQTTITMNLPLTLAIIDGLLVKVAQEHYILPLAAVRECVELNASARRAARGRQTLERRGELIPFVSLRSHFGLEGQGPELEYVVVTETGATRVGLVVDEVIGGYQTVIKPMGRAFRSVSDITGATILGDGSVALILDIPRIIRQRREETAENRPGA